MNRDGKHLVRGKVRIRLERVADRYEGVRLEVDDGVEVGVRMGYGGRDEILLVGMIGVLKPYESLMS